MQHQESFLFFSLFFSLHYCHEKKRENFNIATALDNYADDRAGTIRGYIEGSVWRERERRKESERVSPSCSPILSLLVYGIQNVHISAARATADALKALGASPAA